MFGVRLLWWGLDEAALGTSTFGFVGIVVLDNRGKILDKVCTEEGLAKEDVSTRLILAVPLQGVYFGWTALALDDDADGVRQTLRRVGDVGREAKGVTLVDGDVVKGAVLDDLEDHGTLKLVEPLLGWVDVVISARVWAGDEHDFELAVKEELVSDGRLHEVAVFR